MTGLLYWLRRAVDVAWAHVRWAVRRVGYWIRPYDMLADARRWWWQPRQRCGRWQLTRAGVDQQRLWRTLRGDGES